MSLSTLGRPQELEVARFVWKCLRGIKEKGRGSKSGQGEPQTAVQAKTYERTSGKKENWVGRTQDPIAILQGRWESPSKRYSLEESTSAGMAEVYRKLSALS